MITNSRLQTPNPTARPGDNLTIVSTRIIASEKGKSATAIPGQPSAPMAAGNWPGDQRAPIDTAGLWGHTSYEAILYGMDYLRKECDEWYGTDRPRTRLFQRILDTVQAGKERLPPHDQWRINVLGMPNYRKTGQMPDALTSDLRIRRVVIVGGDIAGWMTAAALSTVCAPSAPMKQIQFWFKGVFLFILT